MDESFMDEIEFSDGERSRDQLQGAIDQQAYDCACKYLACYNVNHHTGNHAFYERVLEKEGKHLLGEDRWLKLLHDLNAQPDEWEDIKTVIPQYILDGDIPQYIDHEIKSKSGWLTTKGEYYPCGYCEHSETAYALLNKEYKQHFDHERLAQQLGWIKVVGGNQHPFYILKVPTQKQLDFLFDYCEKHDMDYESTIEKWALY